MDERIQKALEFSNYRLSLFNLKENIKLKVDSMLVYAINGGLFKSSPELISFVKLIIDSGRSSAVFIDINGNPTEIVELQQFYVNRVDRYLQASNYYHVEYTKLRAARSVSDQFKEIFSEDS